MNRRSKAREVALQLLYQRDLDAGASREFQEKFARERLRDDPLVEFCLKLYDGVAANAADLDGKVQAAATNWRLPRMAAVDRNVLRLGAYELLHGGEPAAVVINEAVELARRFGGAGSPAFVNGILDRVRQG